MIYGSRVRQARELRGMPQGELASALEKSPSWLTKLETSDSSLAVSQDALDVLSARLLMPGDFFTAPIPEELGDGSMRFRARKRMTKGQLAAVRRRAELAHEMAHVVLQHVDAPSARVPSLPATTDIEEAAQQTRAALSIPPDVVIPRLWNAIERAGIFVYAMEDAADGQLDAFSTWTGTALERPIIAISEHRSWDRVRHTAAHELGHLVLHRSASYDPGGGLDVEQDADRFAGAFLFPRDAALEELPRPLTLARLAPLKLRWGMSLGALVFRAREIGVIDSARAASLHRQIGVRGWRTREPGADAREPEKPRALRKMVELVYGTPPDARALARHVRRYTADVTRELDRYATPPTARRPTPRRPDGPVHGGGRVLFLDSRKP